jgi:hypothetical protein
MRSQFLFLVENAHLVQYGHCRAAEVDGLAALPQCWCPFDDCHGEAMLA